MASVPLLLRRRVERSRETLTDTEPVGVPDYLRADSSTSLRDQGGSTSPLVNCD